MKIEHPYRQGRARRTTFGYITEDHPGLDRFQNAVSAVSGVIAAIAVIGIAVLTLWEVLFRAAFSEPLGWSVGLIEQSLLVAAAFFGIVTAYRSGAHVAIVSLFNKFAKPVQKVLLILSYVIIIGCLGAIMVGGWRAMAFSFELGEITPPGMADLSVPAWIWKSYVPAASALGLAIVVIDLYRELTSPMRITATDYEPGDLENELPTAPGDGTTQGGSR